ncbi:MAG: hypothetical protein ACI4VU_03465 [Methanobrevibacter sp.]
MIFILTLSISGISAIDTNNSMNIENSHNVNINENSINQSSDVYISNGNNETTNNQAGNTDSIYVSVNGSNAKGDGSNDNPYQSLDYAIENAKDDSVIYMFNGTYNSSKNTGFIINKNLTIKSVNGNVIIDGLNNTFIFNITENTSLILNSITIINGYGDKTTESSFYNKGNLTIISCNLKNNQGFISGISNYGTLTIKNSNLDLNKGENVGDIINYGNLIIDYSTINQNTINNFGNIDINNSKINYGILSNNSGTNKRPKIKIDNTILNEDNYGYLTISDSDITIDNSKFYCGEEYYRIFFKNSNINITKSFFQSVIQLNGNNNITIKYSTLFKVYGSNVKENFVNISSNWWELNKGPNIGYLDNKFKPENWIIVNFTSENPLTKGKDEKLKLMLKFTNGEKVWDIDKDINIIDIPARFECENGKFTVNSGIIRNHVLETEYINNTEETIIYGIINKERLKLLIGRGFTNYTIYVSNNGSDSRGNGSKENPYQSLSRAISNALNGNTIYINSGTYEGYGNSNLYITKNITIKGYNGPVTIKTYINNNIFTIEEWGTLNLYNVKFSSDNKNNPNIIINSNGGDVNLENCSFNNILSPKLVYIKHGYHSNGNLFINNTSFKDISGIGIYGNPSIRIYNSNFTGFSKYGDYFDDKTVILTNNNIHIENCNFENNKIGVISSKDNSAGLLIYTKINEIKIINSTFTNNNGNDNNVYGNNLPVIGFNKEHLNPTYIENCKFIKNQGHCLDGANYIINSSFIGNYGDTIIKNGNEYYGDTLNIYNSSFINNTNNNTESPSYLNQGMIFNGGILNIENTSFINNSAAYGGAIYNYKTTNIKYSIFLDNKAKYLGNDIFNRLGTMNASSNWWGSNEGPNSDKAYRFLGNLILDNWIIMTLNLENYTKDNYTVKVGLNKLTNSKKEVFNTEYSIPDTRIAYFNCTYGKINHNIVLLNNGTGEVLVISNLKDHDAVVSAKIDKQVLNLTISNKSTKILIDNYAIYGDKQIINMTLINVNGYKIANQTLLVSFVNSKGNQIAYRITVNDTGFGKLELNLTPDIYTIIVRYEGNGYFEASNATAILNVLISNTNMIGYNQMYYGKNNDFYVILKDSFNNPLVNKMIYFNISDGKNHYIFITNSDPSGRADINLSINPGKYTINAYFKGDEWYTKSNIILNITIYPSNTQIIVSNKTLYGYGDIYSVKLLDNESNPIKGENIELTISKNNISQTFNLETDDEANAEIAINLLPGTYNITAIYKGNKNYSPSKGKATIIVNKVISRIISNLNVNLTKTNNIVSIKLIDLYGRPIINQTVILTVYEKNNEYIFKSNTDEEGVAYIIVDLTPGEYQGTINYQGNSWYNKTSTGISLTKDTNSNSTTIINLNASDFTQYYGENKYFNITFYNPNAKTQSDKLIVVSIIGKSSYKTYNLTTDVDGIARLQIELNPGNYTITYKYDNIYYGIHVNGTNNITILKTPTTLSLENITINYNSGELYEISLKDINGNTLSNKKITLNLNSAYGTKNYNLTTDNYGVARLKTNLNVGNYIIKVNYSGDNNYYNTSNSSKLIIKGSSNKTATKIECKDMAQEAVDFYQGERGGYFKLTLKDKNGNTLKNKRVQIGFNGVVYNVVTDKNGIGKLQINLAFPGIYTFAIAFLSDDKYEGSFSVAKITITKKTLRISTSTKTYTQKTKSKYISATLKDRKNRLIKGKELKFTINGKTYTAKTNNKGIATIKVNLNTKKIYTYIVNYSGDDRYSKVTATGKIKII